MKWPIYLAHSLKEPAEDPYGVVWGKEGSETHHKA